MVSGFKETYFAFGHCDGCHRRRAVRPVELAFDKGTVVHGVGTVKKERWCCRKCWGKGGYVQRK